MSKRFLAISGLVLIVPVLAFALLRMRAEAPQTPDPDTLPEPIANLQRRVDSGKSRLQYDEPNGYLRSLLENLDIPVSSQSLVFSSRALNSF